MAGAYLIAESVFIITAMLVVSSFSSSVVSVLQDIEYSEKLRLNRIRTLLDSHIEIVYVVVVDDGLGIDIWVKNMGETRLSAGAIKSADLFLTGNNSFIHLTYGDTPPSWNYTLVRDVNGDGAWDHGETIKITANLSTAVIPGEYHLRLIIDMMQADYVFSTG